MADPTAPQNTPLFGVPLAPQPAAPVATTPVAPASPQRYEEKDGKHRGVAGVARDILGTLGDFLLTRLRMPAMYGPAQQKRKLAAAQEGYESDPLGAINRVTSIDPVFGAKLRDQYIDNQRLAATQESTAEARNQRLGLANEAANQRTRTYAASMLGSMGTWDEAKRQQFYPQMREQVINAGKRQGLDLSAELPEAYDGVALDAFIDGAVPVGTQRTQRLSGDRIEATIRGQDVRSADVRRGQDIASGDRAAGRATTERGQDLTAGGRAASDATTRRGQDIRSRDTQRGQDLRPQKFTPDPNKIYVQGGKRFRYNPTTKKYDPVN